MERANAVANRILEIAGDLFGLTLPRLETEIVLSDEGEFWFKMGDPLTDLEVIFGAITRVLPKEISRRLAKKRQGRSCSPSSTATAEGYGTISSSACRRA